jgi:hypothetical protein
MLCNGIFADGFTNNRADIADKGSQKSVIEVRVVVPVLGL